MAIMCAPKGKVFILSLIIILCDLHHHTRKIVLACLATQDIGQILMAVLEECSFILYCECHVSSHNATPPG